MESVRDGGVGGEGGGGGGSAGAGRAAVRGRVREVEREDWTAGMYMGFPFSTSFFPS